MKSSLLQNFIKQFFPLMVAVSALSGLIYWAVQQDIRLTANDPQIQMTEDIIANPNTEQKMNSTAKVNIAQSLAPFVIIYDKQGNITYTNAVLNGKSPLLPSGVLNDTQKIGENSLTWEPARGVRIAAVVAPYTNGFVLAGRNLREVEKREDQLTQEIIVSWFISLIAIAFAIICIQNL